MSGGGAPAQGSTQPWSRVSRYASASNRSPVADASVGWISTSQPPPYGSELIRSGCSSSAGFTAVTVPATGAYTSLTLLVDSTLAERFPGPDLRAHLRQVHEDDVAECLLRVRGDTDPDGVVAVADPLVLRCVTQVRGKSGTATLPSFVESSQGSVGDRTGVGRRGTFPCRIDDDLFALRHRTVGLHPTERVQDAARDVQCGRQGPRVTDRQDTVRMDSRCPSTAMPSALSARYVSATTRTLVSSSAICIASAPASRSSCTVSSSIDDVTASRGPVMVSSIPGPSAATVPARMPRWCGAPPHP